MKLENTEKRDTLREIEIKYEKMWEADRIFEADAPTLKEYPGSVSVEEIHSKEPKFFGTMAYPYVNGTPHLGHGKYFIQPHSFSLAWPILCNVQCTSN